MTLFNGPLDFRFILQPLIAALLAIRAGIRDHKEHRTPFLLTVIVSSPQRASLVRDGRKDVGRVFIFACLMDLIFQIMVLKAILPGQTLLVAFVLAIIPYSLIRSAVNRVAGLL